MAIPVQFQQFKSAGIYRLVYDKSTVLGTNAATLRLVVGYSPKGPFNIPVYIDSTTAFKEMFGSPSKTLEKRGCYFHTIALQALNAGPILCLNLRPFTTETVGAFGIGVENKGNPAEQHPVAESKKVLDIYDRLKFWRLEPTKLNDGNHYIHVCMTDSKDTSASIFIRKAPYSKVREYDITVSDWYKTYGESIPEYLAGLENFKISDFFTEVYAFKGEFIPSQIETSTIAKYFEMLEKYTESNTVVIDGIRYDIDTVKDLGEEEEPRYEVIPASVVVIPMYKQDNSEEYVYHESDVMTLSDGKTYLTDSLDYNPETGEYTVGVNAIEVTVKEYVQKGTGKIYEARTEVEKIDGKYFVKATLVDGMPTNGSIPVKLGDYKIAYDSFDESYNVSFDGPNDSYVTPIHIKNTIKNAFNEDIDALEALFNDSASGALGHYIGCILPNFIDNNYGYKSIDILFNNDSDTHHMMMSLDEDMLANLDPDSEDEKFQPERFFFDNFALKVQYDPEDPGTEPMLSPLYMKGYTFLKEKPAGSGIDDKYAWQEEILNVLINEKGILRALISPSEIDYRYIVDTFESYWNATAELKSQLALLAKSKELCLGLINFPSVKTLMKQAPTTFGKNGIFDVNTVPKNVKLPTEANGASFVGYFTPLKFSDGYVDTVVPSAGLVSNAFMNKYNSRYPYSIVAGPNYANIQYQNLVGPDYHYDQSELHIMEPFGVNCMVYRPTFGTFINSNQTAKQLPKSALSSINVRELVIYLQDEIGKVLQSYQWEFNNPTVRSAIKTKADIICEAVKNSGGLQQYLNVMDESNNTPDIIDNEMCVLSTSIEPGRGMGKMIHELTIYRTGGMSSTIIEM